MEKEFVLVDIVLLSKLYIYIYIYIIIEPFVLKSTQLTHQQMHYLLTRLKVSNLH